MHAGKAAQMAILMGMSVEITSSEHKCNAVYRMTYDVWTLPVLVGKLRQYSLLLWIV